MIKSIIFISSVFLLSSCAHHKDVRPGVNNQHTVSVKSESKQKGSREALAQANHYCDSLGSRAGIVSEEHSFSNPNMDEQTYQNSQTVKDVATILMSGSTDAHKANHAASTALGQAYTTKIVFQCN